MSDTTFPNLIAPEPSLTPEAASGSDVKCNGEASAMPVVKKTPAKRKATPKKAGAQDDENDDEQEEPTTPKPAKKRTPKPKKEKGVKGEADREDNGEAAGPITPPAAPSSKKRLVKPKAIGDEIETPTKKRKAKAAGDGDGKTPAKTPKSTTKATPTTKVKFPECFEEFSEGDKLLVRMRKEGKGWDEIEKAWTKVTGITPGKDVLRKKETKLRAVAVEWKAGDARKLAAFKAQIEEESVAAFKKLEAEKWIKMAEMFKAVGSEYSSPGLQKKWGLMQKKGEVDAKGVYVGDDAEFEEAGEEAEASGGDTQAEENGDMRMEVEGEGEDADADEI